MRELGYAHLVDTDRRIGADRYADSKFMLKSPWAIYLAGALPWFGLLAALLYTEYFRPYQGGGASMWPIAQLFGGFVAAGTGVLAFFAVNKFTLYTKKSE